MVQHRLQFDWSSKLRQLVSCKLQVATKWASALLAAHNSLKAATWSCFHVACGACNMKPVFNGRLLANYSYHTLRLAP